MKAIPEHTELYRVPVDSFWLMGLGECSPGSRCLAHSWHGLSATRVTISPEMVSLHS